MFNECTIEKEHIEFSKDSNNKPLNLESGIRKISEFFTTEIKLIRTIFISFMTVLIICILLYFNYILIGEFFTTIFLSFIASLAVKPLKDIIIKNIEKQLHKSKYFLLKSFIFLFVKLLFRIIRKVMKITQYAFSRLNQIDDFNHKSKSVIINKHNNNFKEDLKENINETNDGLNNNNMHEKNVLNNKCSSVKEKLDENLIENDQFEYESVLDYVKESIEDINITDENKTRLLNQTEKDKQANIKVILNNNSNSIKDNYASNFTFADCNYNNNDNINNQKNQVNDAEANIKALKTFDLDFNEIQSSKNLNNNYISTSLNSSENHIAANSIFSHKDIKVSLEKLEPKMLIEDFPLENIMFKSEENKIVSLIKNEKDKLDSKADIILKPDYSDNDIKNENNNNFTSLSKQKCFDLPFKSTNKLIANENKTMKTNTNGKKCIHIKEINNCINEDICIECTHNKLNKNKEDLNAEKIDKQPAIVQNELNQNLNKENSFKNFNESCVSYSSFDITENINVFSFKINSASYLTIFNNYQYVLVVSLLYVIIFKLTFYLSLTLILVLVFLDFLIRIILDLLIYFLKISEKNFLRSILFEDAYEATDDTGLNTNYLANENSMILTDNETNENCKFENVEKYLEEKIAEKNKEQISEFNPQIANNGYKEDEKNLIKKNKILKHRKKFDLNENAHSIISLLIIILFTMGLVIFFTIFLMLFYFDLKKIYFMLSENNDFVVDYFKNFIPNNISEFYFQNLETGNNNIKQNKLFIGLKSIEAIFNSSFEGNVTEPMHTNFTIYDISNKIYSFVLNPSKFEELKKMHFSGNETQSIALNTASATVDEEMEFCSNYESETVYKILSKISNYALNLFCGLRAFTDYLTQYVINNILILSII